MNETLEKEFFGREPGGDAWFGSSVICRTAQEAAESLAREEFEEGFIDSGVESRVYDIEVSPADDENEVKSFKVELRFGVEVVAIEQKDQLDHALDLYRHPDTARIGATFEQCLNFVKAVDGEAESRRRDRPIRSHEGDQEVQP